ncbi:MAG TPA: AMP-binding protein [Acidimicrobiales bacterium]|nr:AMP-binding protein [Acidimicrobiales bacterium]
MRDLVALDLPGGQAFVTALERAWDDGDAVAPLDPRLPAPARAEVLRVLAPTAVVGTDSERRPLAGGRPVEDGDALVIATSGTTGTPKAAVLTNAAVAASAEATSARLGVDPRTDRWLACLPLAHVGGLSVVTRALLTGTPLTVHPAFDPDAAVASGATLVSLVATALDRLDPSAFRVIVLGGSAPPATVPPNAVTTYGLTETGSGVVYDGRPLDGVDVRIAADGEVQVRGPMLLRAYRDGTDPKDAAGWLATGDVGRLDEGRLVVEGRRDDMIVTGGENVWPETVERVLAGTPGVFDVAVAGELDAEWGQRVVAYVVAVEPVPSLSALRERVKEALPAWCAPRRLVFVESLPRTALGKVRRDQLTARTPAPPSIT